VPGLAYVVFQWLKMRQGVQTIKPDVHIRDFVLSVAGVWLEDEQLVEVLLNVAEELQVPPADLDWRIWETHRKGSGSRDPQSTCGRDGLFLPNPSKR
jgi:hypothetical protein